MVGHIAILRPLGKLDATSSRSIRHQIDTLLQGNPQILLIDLGQTTFMDSSGLGVLISAMRQAQLQDARLVLCGIQPQVSLVMEASNTMQLFEFYSSQQDFEQAVLTHDLP